MTRWPPCAVKSAAWRGPTENPYVASASFEPERFAVSGRGIRRVEFRNVPAGASVRIYTVRGTLVQTLEHDGVDTSFVRVVDHDVKPGVTSDEGDGDA